MPGFLLPLIGAGMSLLGNVFGASNQNKQNEKQREFSLEMYNRQRADSLSDWAMQNEYNSPSSQMSRLRSAGLNPNLVYGNGAVGNAGGTVRSSSPGSYDPKAFRPDFSGVSNSLMSIYDAKLKDAQVDNLKASQTVAVQDVLLKAAQTASTVATTANTGQQTETSKFNLSQAQALAGTTIEKAKADLDKVRADTDYVLNNDERAAVQNIVSVRKAAEEILSMRLGRAKTEAEIDAIRGQIQDVQRSVKLKDLDIQLKSMGIMPSDPMWSRILGRVIGNPEEWKNSGNKTVWDTPGVNVDSLKAKMGIPGDGYKKFLEDRKKYR